jgi:hypothetical protein
MTRAAPQPNCQSGLPRQSAPPVLARAGSKPKARLYPLYIVLGCLLALASARMVEWLPWALPPCGFRVLTGLPCPFCGGTRCLIAWSHLDVAGAFSFNPLVAVSGVGLVLWALARLLGWAPKSGSPFAWQVIGRKGWLIVALAVMLNWIYLVLHLPR